MRRKYLTAIVTLGSIILALGCSGRPRSLVIVEPPMLPRLAITSGPADLQVFQRDAGDKATISCEGTCDAAGTIWGRLYNVTQKKQFPAHLGWQQVGSAEGGRWQATFRDVPTGGPYTVNLELRNAAGQAVANVTVQHLLVGDLWVLAGQSNMEGYGDLVDTEPASSAVHSYGMNERWDLAVEPLHWLSESPDLAHHIGKSREQAEAERKVPRGPRAKGAGPALPFAKELYARTNVPIGLVPCAHGGTSMDQWDPAKYDPGKPDTWGDSLYGSMMKRFRAVGGRVKGVLWYQGEGEANRERQPVYRERMRAFIGRVRQDFGDPGLAFYMVQISRVTLPLDADAWSAVREDQRVLGQEVRGAATVSAIDLELDDIIHIGTQGNKRLGRRLAIVAHHELFSRKLATGPRLKSATLDVKASAIHVVFENVNGRLTPEHHIAGFSLRTPDGKPAPEFYDVKRDPDDPSAILCQFAGQLAPGTTLWYGYGLDPYCNLTDEQDMAAAAFGPVAVTPAATQPK